MPVEEVPTRLAVADMALVLVVLVAAATHHQVVVVGQVRLIGPQTRTKVVSAALISRR